MRVLVVGSGGREHALCWKLAQEAEVHCAPGNPGIAEVAQCHDVNASDIERIVELAKSLAADLVLVGPEGPLIAGLGDRLRAQGLYVFGPNESGARLEGSKAFSKELMIVAKVPTAASWTANSPECALKRALQLLEHGPVVIKASGLALGKGVVICDDENQTRETIRQMMVDALFGDAGKVVVIEEFLSGREFSLLTLANEKGIRSLPVAQDYKRIGDGDKGPNTGGMGSFSPVDWIDANVIEQTEDETVKPILDELAKRGIAYRGVLFSGMMLTSSGPKCLEYNVRFGDPETQSALPRLGRGLASALLACAKGASIPAIEVSERAAVTVVLASEGYPGPIKSCVPISIDSQTTKEAIVFHAGTALKDGQLVTAGGRVMGVTALADTLPEARTRAYEAVKGVRFEGMQFRTDIALV